MSSAAWPRPVDTRLRSPVCSGSGRGVTPPVGNEIRKKKEKKPPQSLGSDEFAVPVRIRTTFPRVSLKQTRRKFVLREKNTTTKQQRDGASRGTSDVVGSGLVQEAGRGDPHGAAGSGSGSGSAGRAGASGSSDTVTSVWSGGGRREGGPALLLQDPPPPPGPAPLLLQDPPLSS